MSPAHRYATYDRTDDGALLVARWGVNDIEMLDLAWDGMPRPLLNRPFVNERRPALSPNQDWLAYVSDESTAALAQAMRVSRVSSEELVAARLPRIVAFSSIPGCVAQLRADSELADERRADAAARRTMRLIGSCGRRYLCNSRSRGGP